MTFANIFCIGIDTKSSASCTCICMSSLVMSVKLTEVQCKRIMKSECSARTKMEKVSFFPSFAHCDKTGRKPMSFIRKKTSENTCEPRSWCINRCKQCVNRYDFTNVAHTLFRCNTNSSHSDSKLQHTLR